MTDIDKAIGENIGWRHAVTWCVGLTVIICMSLVGYIGDELSDELKSINEKLGDHGERIAVVEVLQETYSDRMCIIEKNMAQHVYKTGP